MLRTYFFPVFLVCFAWLGGGCDRTPRVETVPKAEDGFSLYKDGFPFYGVLMFEGRTLSGTIHPDQIGDDLYDLRLIDRDFGRNEFRHVMMYKGSDEQESSRRIETCNEYLQAVSEGYYARSTLDMALSTHFYGTIQTVEFYRQATRPRESFLGAGIFDVGSLPLEMLAFLSIEIEMSVEILEKAGVTIADLLMRGVAEAEAEHEDHRVTIHYQLPHLQSERDIATYSAADLDPRGDSGMNACLVETGRADFDNDGREDILAVLINRPNLGSAFNYRHLLVSRDAPGAPLRFAPPPPDPQPRPRDGRAQ